MHAAAQNYVLSVLGGRHFGSVVEIGGRDINGGVSHLFTCDRYVSIDLEPGPGVDIVADATLWSPDGPVDLVICCEVLEHAPDQQGVIEAALSWLAPGGQLVITAGGPGRAPHSGHDGGAPHDGEWYGNLDPDNLKGWLTGCSAVDVQYAAGPCDVYATAVKGLPVAGEMPADFLELTPDQLDRLTTHQLADQQLQDQARAGHDRQGVL